ncbi:MAG: error-prone DNA polymerase, partial [Pseudomonadota bacterium]
YSNLCELITCGRRAAEKGQYALDLDDYAQHSGGCSALFVPPYFGELPADALRPVYRLAAWCARTLDEPHLAFSLHHGADDARHLRVLEIVSRRSGLQPVATGDVHMHCRSRRALQDAMTCIRLGCTLENAGRALHANGERHLRSLDTVQSLYPRAVITRALRLAERCQFSLRKLDYVYPTELVPSAHTATTHLRALTLAGESGRWPNGTPDGVRAQIEHELELITELGYEHFFLTVHDVVAFARSKGILCQGRGSAANSAVCFCLGITEVNPVQGSLLFERFISRERNEPPDIDVDFEHERREEVIQYLYDKYGRQRAALAATVVTYRSKSAVRELAKVLGFAADQIDALTRSMAWWDGAGAIPERLAELGLDVESPLVKRFLYLLGQLVGMPRHLSQHVGGFVISEHPLHTLVPVENAAMPDRTIIQWDKDDLEALGLLKVDVLALGMLSAIRKCFALVEETAGDRWTLANLPDEDSEVYAMMCKADTVGVFQIESRAQMTMLPRLRPRTFYDLVIEVAIMRPGPIQGGMVNPFIRRRQGLEPVVYPSKALEAVLKRTLGVPVFQEQVMQIAMVAAGFNAGEADALRRSMAAWGRHGKVEKFREKLMAGMYERGYPEDFAEAVFNQIKGFGAYGFPESHAASFALLVYASCWLKYHHPAAFCCALLNSQPMGFYSPSDLVRDARRHGVEVRPIDVLHSGWDHHLEALEQPAANSVYPKARAHTHALRLGMRLVAGLPEASAERVVAARRSQSFSDFASLAHVAALDRRDRQALSDAGALQSLAGHRHNASWQVLGVETLPGMLNGTSQRETALELPAPTEAQNTLADYRSTGLTLGQHPLALLRPRLRARRVITSEEWALRNDGSHVRLAGLVTVRQRPGSAKGVMFVTLEDECGHINVICWQNVVERYRKALLGTRLLIVSGNTQRADRVCHLVARKVEDVSSWLGSLDVSARNFH